MTTNTTQRHRRMWINQPSKLQPLADQHGRYVITDDTYSGNTDEYVMCLYVNGPVTSGFVPRLALSAGWPSNYRGLQHNWDD